MNSSADAHTQTTPETTAPEASAETLGYTLWAVLRRDPTNPYSPRPTTSPSSTPPWPASPRATSRCAASTTSAR
ncbi:hypothetical protein [Frondihabitans sucicola]|uniref:hypothetical protein n=1 Tax=Frondihabitans sucicola TaxID=1268041 RepID=UPI0033065202